MAITIKGFQGTVSDTDMATQLGAHHGPTVRSAADLAPSAVANTRAVSVAAGTSDHAFIKYTSDAAQQLALQAPNSGGIWYLIAVNRQWSPTNTAVLEAVNTLATTDGTVPTVLPIAVVNAAKAVLRNQPGTAGSSPAGAHAPIALVHVRAADTTVTVFDLRMRRTGAGNLVAPTLHGAYFAAVCGLIVGGAVVAVSTFQTPTNGFHVRSIWQMRTDAVAIEPASTISGNEDNTADVKQHLLDISSASGGVVRLPPSSEFIRDQSGDPATRLSWKIRNGVWWLMPNDQMVAHANFSNLSTDPRALANGNWTDLVHDGVVFDPFSMRNGDSVYLTLPWTGRYAISGRVNLTSDDTSNRYIFSIATDVVDLAWKSVGSLVRAGAPLDIAAERVLAAGTKIRLRMYKDGTNSQYQERSYGGYRQLELVVRFMGAA